ncbi:ATP-binding cassette domain-containing protein [Arcobacteraceae bacterium]|nr:ATP-binding cassette domain-containing protein [Arcobacteraceae bacterium]
MLKIDIKKKIYNQNTILKNVNLEIKDVEFVSIIGPSGCGKTTILRLASLLDTSFEGSIFYNKQNHIDNLGFIFQDSRLLPWLSVKENIMLVSKDKNEEKVEELLIEVGLGEYINAFIKELSGGMKRRVSIVRAFINNPEVLLLDEPFISLDYPTAQSLRQLVLKFYKKYSPIVLFVTHDLNEALLLSNRIIFLGSSPTSIIYEYQNDPIFDDVIANTKKEEILKEYPNLLSGRIN